MRFPMTQEEIIAVRKLSNGVEAEIFHNFPDQEFSLKSDEIKKACRITAELTFVAVLDLIKKERKP